MSESLIRQYFEQSWQGGRKGSGRKEEEEEKKEKEEEDYEEKETEKEERLLNIEEKEADFKYTLLENTYGMKVSRKQECKYESRKSGKKSAENRNVGMKAGTVTCFNRKKTYFIL